MSSDSFLVSATKQWTNYLGIFLELLIGRMTGSLKLERKIARSSLNLLKKSESPKGLILWYKTGPVLEDSQNGKKKV
jgi:hypothetical protein